MTFTPRKDGTMAENDTPKREFAVGYRKPPQRSRFKKGQSGNPAGRPKGTPNLATALERVLNLQVVVNEGGRRHTLSKLEATVKQLVNKAMMGDSRATQQLLKVLQVIEGDSSAAGPPNTTVTETDELVMRNLSDRIRATTPGGNGNAPHA